MLMLGFADDIAKVPARETLTTSSVLLSACPLFEILKLRLELDFTPPLFLGLAPLELDLDPDQSLDHEPAACAGRQDARQS